jgi:hypothetical protein
MKRVYIAWYKKFYKLVLVAGTKLAITTGQPDPYRILWHLVPEKWYRSRT